MSERDANSQKGVSLEIQKTCESCGNGFSCFTGNCWCSELPNIMPFDEKKECLCKSCLELIIAGKYKERGLTPEK